MRDLLVKSVHMVVILATFPESYLHLYLLKYGLTYKPETDRHDDLPNTDLKRFLKCHKLCPDYISKNIFKYMYLSELKGGSYVILLPYCGLPNNYLHTSLLLSISLSLSLFKSTCSGSPSSMQNTLTLTRQLNLVVFFNLIGNLCS